MTRGFLVLRPADARSPSILIPLVTHAQTASQSTFPNRPFRELTAL